MNHKPSQMGIPNDSGFYRNALGIVERPPLARGGLSEYLDCTFSKILPEHEAHQTNSATPP
jgi:hypothetical protein